MTKTYYFNVKMSCGGCSGAVDRALKAKADEFESYKVSLEDQIVEVTAGDDDYEAVKAAIKKTGKETNDATEEEIKQYVEKQAAKEEEEAKA
ncbi:Cytosolic copper metallochaperone [Coemansia sp. RSA 1933]|nr:Cytosolic copper metallochaperone [Coemansia sp. RSA 1933]